MNETMPPDLNAAIATEPTWLQLWVLLLVITNLAAILFVVNRQDGKLRPRIEALAIVASFIASGVMMTWLYSVVGYVRLLGLAHLVFWLPVYIWLLIKFSKGAFTGAFKVYLLVYFAIAGLSLIVDAVDLVRYLIGDGDLLAIAGA